MHSLWLTSADKLWKNIIEAKRAAHQEKELSHLLVIIIWAMKINVHFRRSNMVFFQQ